MFKLLTWAELFFFLCNHEIRVEKASQPLDIRRIIVVLEALQSCKKFTDVSELRVLLFGLMARYIIIILYSGLANIFTPL
jgi:hypothetical protein